MARCFQGASRECQLIDPVSSDNTLRIFSVLKEIGDILGLKQIINFIVVVFAIHPVISTREVKNDLPLKKNKHCLSQRNFPLNLTFCFLYKMFQK